MQRYLCFRDLQNVILFTRCKVDYCTHRAIGSCVFQLSKRGSGASEGACCGVHDADAHIENGTLS